MSYTIKTYYVIGLLFISAQVFASQHKAMGVHGMVLLQINQQFYASHLPLAHSMHSQQIVFRLSVNAADKKNIQDLVADNPLVTIMPERFDLHRLMDHRLSSFKASIFAGHFERGGREVLRDVSIYIDEIMLNEPMQSSGSLVTNGAYYQLALKNGEVLFVHKIAANPSFDHIFLGKIASNMATDLIHAKRSLARDKGGFNKEPLNDVTQIDFNQQDPVSRVDAKAQLNAKGIDYVQSLYLETQDFER